MRSIKGLTILVLLGSFVFLLWNPALAKDQKVGSKMKSAEMGKRLVMIAGCNDCHSPKVFSAQGPSVDPTRRLAGHWASESIPAVPSGVIAPDKWGALTTNSLTAWAGPWGVSYAFNLTPDKQTGLGNWTLEKFKKVIRSGKDISGQRDILPPMPWDGYATMTDAEFQSVWAYLQSLPAVSNAVPAPMPPPGMGNPSGKMEK
jgi:hypothetical protein